MEAEKAKGNFHGRNGEGDEGGNGGTPDMTFKQGFQKSELSR
jgi:hypothetical protein